MKATERKRLERKDKKGLIAEIDELQLKVRGMLAQYRDDDPLAAIPDPPFYWGIAFIGWGSFEDNVDFIDGGEGCATPQAAVDAWEDLRQQQLAKASDQDSLDPNAATLLVYRIDEIGRATTDRRWVFRAKGE